MAKVYSQAKIVFNKSAGGEINMRVFETLSCGSLLLTDRLKPEVGLEELFQDRKHLVLYDDENDLLEKIDYYLRNESDREEIAYNGYKEVLSKHTYEHRVKEMFNKIFTKR
ncbi:MAG: glycosyltransferase [Endomicrobiia bacterium]